MKETLYTIGEMAKLANVSIKALRYYDKIDLFKPAHVDSETNYRYYKDSQLSQLDLIKSLKYIGTPLEEVKKAQEMNPWDLLNFITEQEKLIQMKLDNLMKVQQNIETVKKRMERHLHTPSLGEVFLWEEEETTIIEMAASNIKPNDLTNASYSMLKKAVEPISGFLNTGYGAIFSYEPYIHIEDIVYSKIFAPVLNNQMLSMVPAGMKVETIHAGTYVCIVDAYHPEKYIHNYQKLMEFIETNQLTVISDVYEIFGAMHYSANNQEEFIIEVKVRVA
ncbi:MerR family transcriptional regulator [Pradoshia sp.]